MEARGMEGDGSFFSMFHKKKKTKAYLLNFLKQLSVATEEQVAVIKALTEQNKLHQEWRQLQETLLKRTEELQKFKDQNETIKENLDLTLRKLEKAEEDLFTKDEREQGLEEVNTQLSEDLRITERNLAETLTQLALYKERFKYADEMNKDLKTSSEKYKEELEAIKSSFVEEHMKSKLLEQEVVYHTEMMEYNNKARFELARQIEDLRETLRKERIGAITTELTIDAENECLKFDVHSLSKEIQKLSEQLNTIQHEKLLLMSYYTRKASEREPLSNQAREYHQTRAITVDTTDGCLSIGSSETADEMHPEVIENITLKNKLISVQSKLFRREQLIEELVARIREKDQAFNIQDDPSLKIYLDEDSSQHPSGIIKESDSYQILDRAKNHNAKLIEYNSPNSRPSDTEFVNTSKKFKRHKSFFNRSHMMIVK